MGDEWRDQLRHPDPLRRRDAIIKAGKSGEVSAVKLLQQLLAWETEPALRRLAEKALQHLARTRRPVAGMESQPLSDPLGVDEALRYFLRAKKAHQQSGAGAAAPMLAKALHLDPTLKNEAFSLQIAHQVTGLPADEALDALVNAERYGQIIRRNRGGWVARGQTRTRHWGLLLVTCAFFVFLMLHMGVFDHYLSSLQHQALREKLIREDFAQYYLIVPEGEPPAQGWGVVVALHDYSADAHSLLPLFSARAAEAGVILVVPTFGDYPQPFSQQTTPALNQILQHVRDQYAVHDAGAVVFGYGFGGEIATLYANEYYHVAGVVAVGAERLIMPPSDDPSIRYIIVYGEFDSKRQAVQPQLDALRLSANATEIYVSYGIGAELHPDHVDVTMDLARRVFR